jgi:hypothetical protein
MRLPSLGLLVCLAIPSVSPAQDAYKVEVVEQAPPKSYSSEVTSVLEGRAYRVLDDRGEPFVEIWLRKSIPASSKPGAPKGTIQFPFLADGELLGVAQLAEEGHDFRDQPIEKGSYTIRYGLQPVNGDHLGVSPFRDYSLLLPAAVDKTPKAPSRKELEARSAESAGTSHPAIFFMLTAPRGKSAPAILHDEEKNRWSVLLPLSVQVSGESEAVTVPVQIIIEGMADV